MHDGVVLILFNIAKVVEGGRGRWWRGGGGHDGGGASRGEFGG